MLTLSEVSFSQWPGLAESLPNACLERPVETTQLINYITHMSGGLGNTLFDSRRRTCHSLILNYFCAGGGLSILLGHLGLAIKLLETTAEITIQPHLVAARGFPPPFACPSQPLLRLNSQLRLLDTSTSDMLFTFCIAAQVVGHGLARLHPRVLLAESPFGWLCCGGRTRRRRLAILGFLGHLVENRCQCLPRSPQFHM